MCRSTSDAGEAYADTQRQLAGIRQAVAEAGAEVATSAADLERAARDGRTVVLLGCEGGDFLEGDLGRLEEARAAGLTVLTLVRYRVSDIGDVQTEAPVHDGLSRFGRGGRGRRPGRRLALRNHQPVPRRLRHRDHAARRGGRPGPRGPRHRPGRNYRPVLASYDQLDDLTGLLAARGLSTARIHQILGGNALEFLAGVL